MWSRRHRIAAVALCCLAAGPATTAPAQVDNPDYRAWAKFKPGSAATLAGDMDVAAALKVKGPNRWHYALTFTLVAVTADHATVRVGVKDSHNDEKAEEEPNVETSDYPAKVDADDEWKRTGTVDVVAMGRTFKCDVIEGHGGIGPCSGGPCKMYVCDDVPGGLVKYVGEGPGGNPLTLVVTGYTIK